MIDFQVNAEKCISCGQCAADCVVGILSMEEGLPVITREENCLKCGHCLAVCPAGAISILGRTPEESLPMPKKNPEKDEWMKQLIRGRRSVRRFRPEDIERNKVADLLETALHAPTGHNDQGVHFTVVQGQEAMRVLKEEVYSGLAQELASRSEKSGDVRSTMLGWALSMWQKKGIDALFRSAPALLISHAPKNNATPKEDCIIAMTTFELAAQAAGLGTLWDGLATWSIADFCPGLPQKLGIPEDHHFGYAMIFGKPAVSYHRTVERTTAPLINWASL